MARTNRGRQGNQVNLEPQCILGYQAGVAYKADSGAIVGQASLSKLCKFMRVLSDTVGEYDDVAAMSSNCQGVLASVGRNNPVDVDELTMGCNPDSADILVARLIGFFAGYNKQAGFGRIMSAKLNENGFSGELDFSRPGLAELMFILRHAYMCAEDNNLFQDIPKWAQCDEDLDYTARAVLKIVFNTSSFNCPNGIESSCSYLLEYIYSING